MRHGFFHSSDLDGMCAGAIVKYRYPDCKMHPINYGDRFPWSQISSGDDVYMVDFSLTMAKMIQLDSIGCKVLWIDHHISNIGWYEDVIKKWCPFKNILAILQDGKAGCELTWEALLSDDMPEAVKLLGIYDTWRFHKDNQDQVLSFQYGLRLEDTNPENQGLWNKLFNHNVHYWVDHYIRQGRVVLKYVEQSNAKYVKAVAFEVTINNLKCIAINKMLTNSQLFDSIWDPDRYDTMVTFGWMRDHWVVSMYTTKESVDVSEVCKKQGGGGHKQAAGFTSEYLPWFLAEEVMGYESE